MKIAVIGAGAMGSLYAALLVENGHQVWAIDLWKAHLEAIQKHGLRIKNNRGERVVRGIRVAVDVDPVTQCDLVIIATKASAVAAVAKRIAPLVKRHTLILTIQNGLGVGERIKQYLPANNLLLGVAQGFGAVVIAPGLIQHANMNLIRIGAMNGGADAELERIVAIWRQAGFHAQAYEDINQLIWEKFICNVTFSAPCTVFNCTVGALMADPASWKIGLRCGFEAYEAGRRKGVNLSFVDPEKYVTEFGNKLLAARPSMLLDHMAARRSEIDAINGMVPVIAAQVGTEAPYNAVMTEIVRDREARF